MASFRLTLWIICSVEARTGAAVDKNLLKTAPLWGRCCCQRRRVARELWLCCCWQCCCYWYCRRCCYCVCKFCWSSSSSSSSSSNWSFNRLAGHVVGMAESKCSRYFTWVCAVSLQQPVQVETNSPYANICSTCACEPKTETQVVAVDTNASLNFYQQARRRQR